MQNVTNSDLLYTHMEEDRFFTDAGRVGQSFKFFS